MLLHVTLYDKYSHLPNALMCQLYRNVSSPDPILSQPTPLNLILRNIVPTFNTSHLSPEKCDSLRVILVHIMKIS